MTNDLKLLQDYARNRSERSFTILVNRHLNLVYSAALRQVRSPELAQEVAQSTFVDLARQAPTLAETTVLPAWLYQVTRRTAINVIRREARRQLREQSAFELNVMNASGDDWTQVGAMLDEAMHHLEDADRTAVVLRYFENKSLHEVGGALGTSDNAAQKRIARAIERLRDYFSKHGVTIGAGGLAAAISANSVQAAPAGLAVTISTTSLLAGTNLACTASAGISKAITMTTLVKTTTVAALIAAVGTGLFEAHQTSALKTQIQTLQQNQAPLVSEIETARKERDDTGRRLATVTLENERLAANRSELLRLRGEVGILREQVAKSRDTAGSSSSPASSTPDNAVTPENIGRDIGMAVTRGEAGAFAKLAELAVAELAAFRTNNQGAQSGDDPFAPLHAAFKVISDASAAGNRNAVAAVNDAMDNLNLRNFALGSLGAIAGNGNETALQILLNPEKYGILKSSTISALQPAADNGIQPAIDALATVAGDTNQAPLWYMTAKALQKASGSGNSVAIDALVGMSNNTNMITRTAVASALNAAAVNNNARAAAALRAMGY